MGLIKWENVKFFRAIVENKSISKAAESMFFSQPHLSKRLAELERDVGAQLLVRGHDGVELTRAGRILYERSLNIDGMIQNLVSDVSNATSLREVAGPLRVASGLCAGGIASDAVYRFVKNRPDMDVTQLIFLAMKMLVFPLTC